MGEAMASQQLHRSQPSSRLSGNSPRKSSLIVGQLHRPAQRSKNATPPIVEKSKLLTTPTQSRFSQSFVQVPIQQKPALGSPALSMPGPTYHRYEREADSKARQVVSRLKPDQQPIHSAASGPSSGPSLGPSLGMAGQSLAPSIHRPMEQAFGANFNHVRIHADSQSDRLNNNLQARAFTTGQDIFFRRGEYQPNSKPGQELIAHELAHVVQQRRLGKSLVQRKSVDVLVTGTSHLVKKKNGTIYGGQESDMVFGGQVITIDSAKVINSRRGPNQERFNAKDKTGPQHYTWYKVISIDGVRASKNQYIRKDVFVPMKSEPQAGLLAQGLDKGHDVVEAVTTVPATLIGNEGVTGVADALNDKTVKTNTGGGDKATAAGKAHARSMGIVGDSITGATGLLGMAKGFKDLVNPEKKASELFIIGLEIEQGAAKTGEFVAKMVHTGSKSDSPTVASRFGSTFEGFGAAFAGIKEGFFAMKKILELIKNRAEYEVRETVKKSMEVSLHILEAAKSIVLSVKAFIELVQNAAAGGLMAAVPGLDIAIAAAKIIMSGYYLAISNRSRNVMNKRRKELAGDDTSVKDLHGVSQLYRAKDAEIANLRTVIAADERNKKLKAANQGRAGKLKQKVEALQTEKAEIATHGFSQAEVAEYSLVTELRDANRKRVVRQSIHLVTEAANIAGAIATLTGVGALGGGIVKGTVAAVDLSLPAARMAKQAGRDRTARKIAKGKKTILPFDPTKSTAAKASYRLKQVQHLIRLIIQLWYEKGSAKDNPKFRHVDDYLTASGVNTRKLYQENGNPQKQIRLLVDAIRSREL